MIVSASAEDPIDERKDALEELKEKEEKYRKLIDLKAKQKSSIDQQVNTLESESRALEKNIVENTNKITVLLEDIKIIKEDIAQKNASIASQKTLLASLIRNQYDTIRSSEQIEDLFPQTKQRFSFENNQSQITEKLSELTTIIVSEKIKLERSSDTLDSKRKEVETIQNNLKQKNRAVERARETKKLDALETQAEQIKYEKHLEDVLAEQLDILNEINSLGSTHDGSFDLSDLPSKKDVNFSRPVKSPYKVTQGYGKTSFSHHYKGGHHNGVDYSGRNNRSVLSVGKGKVLAVGNMGRYGYGKWVAIDHENGLVSLYGHLSQIHVNNGQRVDRKDQIGVMGNTGFSTATHLHLSLFVKSTFRIVNSSSVKGVRIPSGATVNPAVYY